jgi:hypothetical protein
MDHPLVFLRLFGITFLFFVEELRLEIWGGPWDERVGLNIQIGCHFDEERKEGEDCLYGLGGEEGVAGGIV